MSRRWTSALHNDTSPAWSCERNQIAELLGAFSRHAEAEKSIRYFVVILIGYFAVADREQAEPHVGLVKAQRLLQQSRERRSIQLRKNISANALGTTSKRSRSVDPRSGIAGSSQVFRALDPDR